MTDGRRILRASEIGEYVFCHRAWWLHVIQGIEPPDRKRLQLGVTRHHDHGRDIRRALLLQRAAILFLVMSILLGLALAVEFLLAVS